MRKSLAIAAILLGSLFLFTPLASAGNDNSQVCAGTHIDPPGDPTSVTVTAPDGQLVSAYCVKAGSLNQSNGPVYVTVDPPTKTVTVSHPSSKEISHYTLTFVTVSDDTTTTTEKSPPTTVSGGDSPPPFVEPAPEIGTASTVDRLPVTGSNDGWLAGLAVLCIIIGLALIAIGASLRR